MTRKAKHALGLGSDLVELRLDSLKELQPESIVRSFSGFSGKCVITLRGKSQGGSFRGSELDRMNLLVRVSELEPAYADVELEAAIKFPHEVKRIRANSGRLIVSWHNFQTTPSRSTLLSLFRKTRRLGDIAKQVTMAKAVEDNIKVLSLYKFSKGSDLIAFCMGSLGTLSRIMCLFAGSPLTYSSLPDEAVAPGQLSIETMRGIVDAVW